MKLLKDSTYKALKNEHDLAIKAANGLNERLAEANQKIRELEAKLPKINTDEEHLRDSLELVYTDRDGLNFYVMPVDKLPRRRQVDLQAVLKQMEAGIDVKTLQAFCEEILNANRAVDVNRVNNLASALHTRAAAIAVPALLYQAALIICFVEGEPLSGSRAWDKRKAELFEKDDELRFFFTYTVMSTIMSFSNMSEQEFAKWISLREIQILEENQALKIKSS